MMADVEFGMPSEKCGNFGICRISPAKWARVIKSKRDRTSKAIATIYDHDHVELDFLRYSFTKHTYDLFFSRGKFLVMENYKYVSTAEDEICFCIPKGEYPIEENNSLIKIVFRVPA